MARDEEVARMLGMIRRADASKNWAEAWALSRFAIKMLARAGVDMDEKAHWLAAVDHCESRMRFWGRQEKFDLSRATAMGRAMARKA